jgi:hypothetical protein
MYYITSKNEIFARYLRFTMQYWSKIFDFAYKKWPQLGDRSLSPVFQFIQLPMVRCVTERPCIWPGGNNRNLTGCSVVTDFDFGLCGSNVGFPQAKTRLNQSFKGFTVYTWFGNATHKMVTFGGSWFIGFGTWDQHAIGWLHPQER